MDQPEIEMKIEIAIAQRKLAVLWYVWAGFLTLIMFFQSVLGRYESHVSDAWGWLLPTLMPTLSLITGVLVLQSRESTKDRRKNVDQFYYRLALSFSAGYLFFVTISILGQPLFESYSGVTPLETMNLASLLLGPLHGLVAAVVGIFFVKSAQS